MVRIVLHKSRIKLLPPFILWRPLSLCLLKTRVLQSTAGPKWDKNGKSPIRFKLVLYRIFKSVFFKLFVTVAHPCPSCSLCAVIELSTKCFCRLIVLSRQISSAGIGFYFAKTRLDICSPKGPMQWPARETGGCMHPTFPPHWGLPVLSNCNPNWQKHRVHEDVKFQQVSLRPAARRVPVWACIGCIKTESLRKMVWAPDQWRWDVWVSRGRTESCLWLTLL